MSTKAFDSALDFMPVTNAGKGGRFRTTLKLIAQAINEGREAEATYHREIVRGTEPAKAIAKAFTF